MRVTRIYQPCELAIGDRIYLTPGAVHHLQKVLRSKLGDKIIVFNGEGGEYIARIQKVDKRGIIVELETFNAEDRQSAFDIHLFQALVSNEKMDWIIQKSVELGVKSITPCLTERVTTRLAPERLAKRYQHWQKIITHACEQSGLNRLPKLNQIIEIDEAAKHDNNIIICHPQAKQGFKELQIKQHSITIAIGPEGGFSPDEMSLFAEVGCNMVRLSPRVLRTETAAVSAMTLVQYQAGDLG